MGDITFRHQFRNKRYQVILTNNIPRDRNGDCDKPTAINKSIRIKANLGPRHFLEVALDEGIHACLWDVDNDIVADIAHSLSSYLWKLGYRRVESETTNNSQ